MKKAIFGAGCFWGVEAAFRSRDGVAEAICGYAGGTLDHPTYELVCTGRTGHAEVVEVTYEPTVVSFKELVDFFWTMHDPTTLNRQGPDHGTQYRSIILWLDEDQKILAEESLMEHAQKFPRPIVTQIEQAGEFWPAEDYHQRYFAKRGIAPTCHQF